MGAIVLWRVTYYPPITVSVVVGEVDVASKVALHAVSLSSAS